MRRLVIDASVVVKWCLPDAPGEGDVDAALALLSAIREGAVEVVQPVHWLAEVAAVLCRLAPASSARATALLHAMELPISDGLPVTLRACELSRELGHHLFDTLYHAVALEEPDATLITADDAYCRKASPRGGIVHLADLRLDA